MIRRGNRMLVKRNRREFIRRSSAGLLALGAGGLVTEQSTAAETVKSTVALVRNEKSIDDRNNTDGRELKSMLATALQTITGKKENADIWAALGVTKDDVVAIKLNCNRAGFPLFVHTDLVFVLTESLRSVVPANNIIVYDRYTSELERAGYNINERSSGVRCHGTDRKAGFDSTERMTRIVTDEATKIINIPSLKAFGPGYVGSLFLKNHIGTLTPADMPRCHNNKEMITQVNDSPSIRKKSILGICDGLRACYKRGVPWFWKGIIASTDQVAAEYGALEVINDKLRQEKQAVNPVPGYVKLADTAYNLGTCDPSKIDMRRIEM